MIGAGNIGRGVIGGLFFESGYHLYIYDIMEERMKQLKEQGTYLIERVGANNKRRVLVDDFDVLDCSDTVDLIEHIEKSRFDCLLRIRRCFSKYLSKFKGSY